MKTQIQKLFIGLALLLPLAAQAQFTFVTNNGAITITGYAGSDVVVIPAAIYGYPVTIIGYGAFAGHSLTSVTIPNSVISIGDYEFYYCTSLTNITFQGNAPTSGSQMFTGVNAAAVVYYYAGTSGWGSTYGGLPTVELSAPSNPPQIGGNGSVGVHSGDFGFTIAGVSNQTVVVEASTNLVNWQPVWTNTLSGASTNFTDSQWKNFRNRFYRAR